MAHQSPPASILSPASRFAAPDTRPHSPSPSPSPSRSPNRRRFASQEIDPLLANLSPTSTLEALRATDALPYNASSQHTVLSESIADASTSERALGIRAALAGKKLREWYTETSEWHWPAEQFEGPADKERGYGEGRYGARNETSEENGEQYWGSLPATVVQEMDRRIEAIQEGMDALDVEELKNHIREAHLGSQARLPMRYGPQDLNGRPQSYAHLDDFTLIITATIMQALPYITRLNGLLNLWLARLSVLGQVPGFRSSLDDAEIAMDSAWHAIGKTFGTEHNSESDLDREAFLTMRGFLQDQVTLLGQRLDAMLDTLEGGPDRLPDHWIDSMEKVQDDYESWVVEAERLVDENEWIRQRNQMEASSGTDAEAKQGIAPQTDIPSTLILTPIDSFLQDMIHDPVAQSIAEPPVACSEARLRKDVPQVHEKVAAIGHQLESNGLDNHETANERDLAPVGSLREQSETKILEKSSALPSLDSGKAFISESGLDNSSSFETKANLQNQEEIDLHGKQQQSHQIKPSTDGIIVNTAVAAEGPCVLAGSFTSSARNGIDIDEPIPENEPALVDPVAAHVTFDGGNDDEASQTFEARAGIKSNLSISTTDEAHADIKSGENHTISSLTDKLPEYSSIQSSGFQEAEKAARTDTGSNGDSYFNSVYSHDREPMQPLSANLARTGSPIESRRYLAPKLSPIRTNTDQDTTDSSVSSELSNPGSATSGYFSNMSSPEIHDAAMVEYFKTPTEEKPPSWLFRKPSRPDISRQSSQRTERSFSTIRENVAADAGSPTTTRGRSSSFVPGQTIYERVNDSTPHSVSDDDHVVQRVELKRASVTSIEVVSRSDLRNITVRRSGSYSSTSSAASRLKDDNTPPDPLYASPKIEQGLHQDTDPDSPSFSENRTIPSPELSQHDGGRSAPSTKDLVPKFPPKSPPKSIRVLSPGSAKKQSSTLWNPTTPGSSVEPRSPTDQRHNPPPGSNSSKSIDEQLTARISSILTNIPAKIRLADGPDVDSPEAQSSRASSGIWRSGLQAASSRLVSRHSSAAPTITLAPAFSQTSKSRQQSGDPDIKLYHLHQPGKNVPIKLFVRLVGEAGERVMVRVGGGWADLGEYLKEYANHHGRRSISDGKFEIKGLPLGSAAASVATLAALSSSGRSTPISRPSSPTVRPSSSLHVRKARLSNGSSTDFRIPVTPELPSRSYDATPKSAESLFSSGHSSRGSWGEDDVPLGLAGPKSRRGDVSPSKKAWVDGMLDQARRASGSDRQKAGVGNGGDTGKVGGTRRVFLKSRSSEQSTGSV